MTGRSEEVKELNRLYDSGKAEFVAVYGRRRIGKTFLIDETFQGRISFRHAGLSPVDENGSAESTRRAQLEHFYHSLRISGMKAEKKPEDWLEAFYLLEKYLQETDDGNRQLVFIDELPWLDTPKSGFITALEAFWNSWGCQRHNFMLVVCGSASSWIRNKLINNHGGLYNRLTCEIKLSPFTLKECRDLFVSNGICLSDYDIAQSYMALGGIPYYLCCFQRGLSLAQNLDRLFFAKKAVLKNEFDRLFASVFSNPEAMIAIVRALFTKNSGLTRKEITKLSGIPDGGTLSGYLDALIVSDFVTKYVPFGMSKREEHFKLTDPFCLFFLHFVDGRDLWNDSFWQQNVTSPIVNAWRGFAFENLCFEHIQQIKSALGIFGVESRQSAWSKRADDENGTQIDMLIDRNDNIINMCELKFYSEEFCVDKSYHATLTHRVNLLMHEIPKKKMVHSTLITTYGLRYNEYSGDFQKIVTLDDLFQ